MNVAESYPWYTILNFLNNVSIQTVLAYTVVLICAGNVQKVGTNTHWNHYTKFYAENQQIKLAALFSFVCISIEIKTLVRF